MGLPSLNEGRSTAERPEDGQPGRTGGPAVPPTDSPRGDEQEASRGRKPPLYPDGDESQELRMNDTFEVAWPPPYCPELDDIGRIWKYVKGSAMANHDFGEVAGLRGGGGSGVRGP
jgi:hypothetical protein